jgi:hypothetical protein
MHLVSDECRHARVLYRLYVAWLKRCAGAAVVTAAVHLDPEKRSV